jgi:hypothetical protein
MASCRCCWTPDQGLRSPGPRPHRPRAAQRSSLRSLRLGQDLANRPRRRRPRGRKAADDVPQVAPGVRPVRVEQVAEPAAAAAEHAGLVAGPQCHRLTCSTRSSASRTANSSAKQSASASISLAFNPGHGPPPFRKLVKDVRENGKVVVGRVRKAAHRRFAMLLDWRSSLATTFTGAPRARERRAISSLRSGNSLGRDRSMSMATAASSRDIFSCVR